VDTSVNHKSWRWSLEFPADGSLSSHARLAVNLDYWKLRLNNPGAQILRAKSMSRQRRSTVEPPKENRREAPSDFSDNLDGRGRDIKWDKASAPEPFF